jgi:thiamine transport system substrate-binding protein
MKRRAFLAAAGTATAALAGCTGGQSTPSGTLRVATYRPFVDAPSVSPGSWIKEEFETEYDDVTLEWLTPESELNHFIQRRNAGVTIDADVYVGMNADDLVRIDQQLGDQALFEPIDDLQNDDHVLDELRFDPEGRAVPFDTGYISLVYDENEVENPGTFDALTQPEYQGKLIAQNAQNSDTGQAFLLWTIAAKGEDSYLDYWQQLVDNDVRILGTWSAAYNAYSEGEAPMVVSYSTDQVYANRYDQDMSRHQVGFLNDQGYANPEGMAKFATTDKPDLARQFIDWMLSKKVQSKIPVLNVVFPATDHVEPPEDFAQYAHRPPETVTHTYDQLTGNLDGWVEQWAQQIAGN